MKNKKYPNLKSWQAGQSGNPAGRKVGSKNVSTIVRELLDQDAITNELVLNLRAANDSVPVIKLNPPYNMLVDLSEISLGRGERTRSPLATPELHD